MYVRCTMPCPALRTLQTSKQSRAALFKLNADQVVFPCVGEKRERGRLNRGDKNENRNTIRGRFETYARAEGETARDKKQSHHRDINNISLSNVIGRLPRSMAARTSAVRVVFATSNPILRYRGRGKNKDGCDRIERWLLPPRSSPYQSRRKKLIRVSKKSISRV